MTISRLYIRDIEARERLEAERDAQLTAAAAAELRKPPARERGPYKPRMGPNRPHAEVVAQKCAWLRMRLEQRRRAS